MKSCLQPTFYINFEDPRVQKFAEQHRGKESNPKDIAVSLFYAVRDGFRYDPYNLDLRPEAMKASAILSRDSAYCIEKAIVLAAALRACGIPSRLFFGNVRNHIATERLTTLLGTDVMAFHGCTEIWLGEKWVKATPAFNAGLCRHLGVEPLEFDGERDCLFQQYSQDGQKFMDYIKVHGSYDDMPYEKFLAELRALYSHLIDEDKLVYRLNEVEA